MPFTSRSWLVAVALGCVLSSLVGAPAQARVSETPTLLTTLGLVPLNAESSVVFIGLDSPDPRCERKRVFRLEVRKTESSLWQTLRSDTTAATPAAAFKSPTDLGNVARARFRVPKRTLGDGTVCGGVDFDAATRSAPVALTSHRVQLDPALTLLTSVTATDGSTVAVGRVTTPPECRANRIVTWWAADSEAGFTKQGKDVTGADGVWAFAGPPTEFGGEVRLKESTLTDGGICPAAVLPIS